MSAVPALATALLAGGENKKSGPIGLAVILVLCVACYFLFKSMSKHLRKVREEFPAAAPAQDVEPTSPASVQTADGGEDTGAAAQPAESLPTKPAAPGDSA